MAIDPARIDQALTNRFGPGQNRGQLNFRVVVFANCLCPVFQLAPAASTWDFKSFGGFIGHLKNIWFTGVEFALNSLDNPITMLRLMSALKGWDKC